MTEEAGELVRAARQESDERLAGETACLLCHILVLRAARPRSSGRWTSC